MEPAPNSGPISLLPHELLAAIFEFCPFQDNVRNQFVCRTWRDVAGEVAKKQLIISYATEIESKAVNFLALVPGKTLQQICPTFAQFLAMRQDVRQHTITAIRDASLKLTEKHLVCLSKFFRVDPNDPHIPVVYRDQVAGKGFAELHDEQVYLWTLKQEENKQFPWKYYFPIELFGLTLQGAEHDVAGNKNQGTICFPFKGRLIELTLFAGNNAIWGATFFAVHLNRDNASTILLTPPDDNNGYIWLRDIYVVTVDSQPDLQQVPAAIAVSEALNNTNPNRDQNQSSHD